MTELVPISYGLLVGLCLGLLAPRQRLPVGLMLAVLLGVAATVVTGEWKASWAFVLIDIPLVALSATVAYLPARRFRGHQANARGLVVSRDDLR